MIFLPVEHFRVKVSQGSAATTTLKLKLRLLRLYIFTISRKKQSVVLHSSGLSKVKIGWHWAWGDAINSVLFVLTQHDSHLFPPCWIYLGSSPHREGVQGGKVFWPSPPQIYVWASRPSEGVLEIPDWTQLRSQIWLQHIVILTSPDLFMFGFPGKEREWGKSRIPRVRAVKVRVGAANLRF